MQVKGFGASLFGGFVEGAPGCCHAWRLSEHILEGSSPKRFIEFEALAIESLAEFGRDEEAQAPTAPLSFHLGGEVVGFVEGCSTGQVGAGVRLQAPVRAGRISGEKVSSSLMAIPTGQPNLLRFASAPPVSSGNIFVSHAGRRVASIQLSEFVPKHGPGRGPDQSCAACKARSEGSL